MFSRGWMVEWWIFHILYQFPGDVSSWGVLGPAGPTHLILYVSLLISACFFRMYSPIDSVDFPIEFRILLFKSLFICPVHVPSFAYRCPQLSQHLCPFLTQNYDLDGNQCKKVLLGTVQVKIGEYPAASQPPLSAWVYHREVVSSILRNCTRNMTVKTTRTNFVPGCWPRVGLGQKECHSERGKCETLAFYFSKVCFEEIIRHPCQTLYLMRLFCLVCGFAVSKTVWLLHQPFYSVLVSTQWWIAQAHSSIWHTSMPYIGNSRTRVTML